jgi:predicted TIM-barrel fold metal-dependent hydrolase
MSLKGMDDVLCFASGYPNWDSETPDAVMQELPPSWLPKVMRDNASKLFRFSDVAEPLVVSSEKAVLEKRP